MYVLPRKTHVIKDSLAYHRPAVHCVLKRFFFHFSGVLSRETTNAKIICNTNRLSIIESIIESIILILCVAPSDRARKSDQKLVKSRGVFHILFAVAKWPSG
jgi:hypothetical protein